MREYYDIEARRDDGVVEYACMLESAIEAEKLMEWAKNNLAKWEWKISIARANENAAQCIDFLSDNYADELTTDDEGAA